LFAKSCLDMKTIASGNILRDSKAVWTSVKITASAREFKWKKDGRIGEEQSVALWSSPET
jgi:hypothetical protein